MAQRTRSSMSRLPDGLSHRVERTCTHALSWHFYLRLVTAEEFIKDRTLCVCVCVSLHMFWSSVFERVCTCVCEYLAGSRWPWIKTGDECREQESGGAWLGQAMGDNMASHLLEANTHTLHVCNQMQSFPQQTHTLSATNTYANAHAQVYVLPKALTALTLT